MARALNRSCRRKEADHAPHHVPPRYLVGYPAFSLIELIVTISILTVIVFALYAVFNQVQRALRSTITQVDVLESGRAAMQIITRDVEQIAYPRWEGPNIFFDRSYGVAEVIQPLEPDSSQSARRTNWLEELYFLGRSNLFWISTGYFVTHATNLLGLPARAVLQNPPIVGTLYRYSAPNVRGLAPTIHVSSNHFASLYQQYLQAALGSTNVIEYLHAVANGVVHFRWQAFDGRGNLMTNDFRTQRGFEPLRYFTGFSNQPAYLEFELGVVEPQTVEQLRAFSDQATALRFLERNAGKVHLFRQRIPIRSNLP